MPFLSTGPCRFAEVGGAFCVSFVQNVEAWLLKWRGVLALRKAVSTSNKSNENWNADMLAAVAVTTVMTMMLLMAANVVVMVHTHTHRGSAIPSFFCHPPSHHHHHHQAF